jgi:hypothetical protein
MKIVRTPRQRFVVITTVGLLMCLLGMSVGVLRNISALFLISASSAIIIGSVVILVFSPTAFYCAAAFLLPFVIAVIAQHEGRNVMDIWWFKLLGAISIISGIILLVKVVARSSGDSTSDKDL